MRIERKGPVARLTPRLERFFVEALGGEALDGVEHPQARKADYKCLRGLLAIELKSLAENASDQMQKLIDELRECPDWPVFLGSAPIQSILKHMDEPEERHDRHRNGGKRPLALRSTTGRRRRRRAGGRR